MIIVVDNERNVNKGSLTAAGLKHEIANLLTHRVLAIQTYD